MRFLSVALLGPSWGSQPYSPGDFSGLKFTKAEHVHIFYLWGSGATRLRSGRNYHLRFLLKQVSLQLHQLWVFPAFPSF